VRHWRIFGPRTEDQWYILLPLRRLFFDWSTRFPSCHQLPGYHYHSSSCAVTCSCSLGKMSRGAHVREIFVPPLNMGAHPPFWFLTVNYLPGFLPSLVSMSPPLSHSSLGGKLVRTYLGIPVLLAVVGLPVHATSLHPRRNSAYLDCRWNQFLREGSYLLFVSIDSGFHMGHVFFRAVDLSWRLLGPRCWRIRYVISDRL
jgi:hypothetical protein